MIKAFGKPGRESNLHKVINNIYKNPKANIPSSENPSFLLSPGITQGHLSSAVLFNIMLEVVANTMRR
jgi:hypothetical protein